MEKKMLFILAIAVSLILISGCTSSSTQADGKKDGRLVLLEAIKNSKTIASSEVSYDAIIKASGIALNVKSDLWTRGNETRADITSSLMGIPIIARYYKLTDNSFTCMQTNSNWTCEEGTAGELPGVTSPMGVQGEDEQTMLDMITSGAIVVSPDTTEKTIAGRTCDEVNIFINVTKLEEMQIESDLADTVSQAGSSGVSGVNAVQCLDRITGYPLYYKMSMEAAAQSGTGTQQVSFEMTATNYVPNSVISDDIFGLPAEVSTTQGSE